MTASFSTYVIEPHEHYGKTLDHQDETLTVTINRPTGGVPIRLKIFHDGGLIEVATDAGEDPRYYGERLWEFKGYLLPQQLIKENS